MSHGEDGLSGIRFDMYSELPEHLIPTAKQVAKFASHHVVVDDGQVWFDWKAFLDAVNGYPDVDLTFDTLNSNTIVRDHPGMIYMYRVIMDLLKDVHNLALPRVVESALKNTVEATFLVMGTAKENGGMFFSKSEDGSKSSWEYRIQLAFDNPNVPTDFYSLVSVVKLTADTHDEKSWWGLRSSTRTTFSATIRSMRLIVAEGFVGAK